MRVVNLGDTGSCIGPYISKHVVFNHDFSLIQSVLCIKLAVVQYRVMMRWDYDVRAITNFYIQFLHKIHCLLYMCGFIIYLSRWCCSTNKIKLYTCMQLL